MLSILVLPSILFLSFATAQSVCDANNAISAEQFVEAVTQPTTSSGSSDGVSCVVYPTCPYCADDPTAELCRSWKQTQLNDELNANLLNGACSFSGCKRSLRRDAVTLQCIDSEYCVAAMDNFFMCVDATSLDFQDSNGGHGNLESDTYTMSNGEVTVVASTATAVPTPTSSALRSGATNTVASAKATGSSSSSVSGTSNTSSGASSIANGIFSLMATFVIVATIVSV